MCCGLSGLVGVAISLLMSGLEENRVRECGEEKDGLGGAGESSEALWRCWPAVVVEEDEPFLFFDDSSI